MPPNKSNEIGYWESEAIRQLNDRILASAGTGWDDWLAVNPGWLQSPKAEEFREEALELLKQEFGASRLFVLKDPRICRLVPFWLGVLAEAGVRPLVVSPVRNPLEVSASLARRDGFEMGLGHLLWLRHVLDAEFASRGTARFFTSYDRLISGWARTLTDAQSALGITWPRMSDRVGVDIDAFLSDKYRHHQEAVDTVLDNPVLSEWLRGVFEILERWTAVGERPEDFAELDRIRSQLNGAAPAFSRLIAAGQKSADKVTRVEQALGEAQTKLGSAEKAMAAEKETTSRLELELATERQRFGEVQQQVAETRSRLAKAEEASTAQKEAAAQLEKELETERLRFGEAQQQLADARSRLAKAEEARTAQKEAAGRLEKELETERQRFGEAQKQVARLDKELGEARSKLADAEAATAAKQKAAVQLESALGTERQRLGEAEQQISRLESELKGQAEAARTLEQALGQAHLALAEAEAATATEQDKASRLENELDIERRRFADSEQQISRLKDDLDARTKAAEVAEESLSEVRHRLAQTESALAQRRHESEQTAAELASVREHLHQTAAGRAEAEKISTGLKEHVVLLLAELKDRQAALAAAQQAHATDSKHAGEAIAGVADQVRQVLAALETSRHEMATRLSEAEQAHARQSTELKQRTNEVAVLTRLLHQAEGEAAKAAIAHSSKSAELEHRLQRQAEDIAALRRQVEDKQNEAHRERSQAERMRQAAVGAVGSAVTGLLNGHHSSFYWKPYRLKRQAALLRGTGLFDAEWYLQYNTDVAKAGVDPLRHYIEFGAKEGRVPNPGLAQANGHADSGPLEAPDTGSADAPTSTGSAGT